MKARNFEQVNFLVNPAFEFVNALFAIGCEERLMNRAEKVNFSLDSEEVELIKDLKKGLSDYMLKEIKYFFNEQFPFGYFVGINMIIRDGDISSGKELLDQVENSNFLRLVSYILKDLGIECSVKAQEMIKRVESTGKLDKKEKEIILEAVKNPVETLQRYWFMLRQFYFKIYQKKEDEVLKRLKTQQRKFELIFERKAEYFFKYYLKRDIRKINVPVNIHVSFFFQTMCDFYKLEDHLWINMGCYLDKVYGEKALRSRIQEFLKFVADDSRFKMLELLGESPYYGRELAEKLDLKPSTISYHLSRLEKMDLVFVNRKKHKVYYSLDQERLEELFEQAGDFILHRL